MPAPPPNNLPFQPEDDTHLFPINNGDNSLAEIKREDNNPGNPISYGSQKEEGIPLTEAEGSLDTAVGGEKDFFTSTEQTSKVMPVEYRGTGGTRVPLELRPAASSLPVTAPSKNPIFSKKLAIILIILVLGGGAVFVYFNWFQNPSGKVSTSPSVTVPAPPASSTTPAESETAPGEQVNPLPPSPNQDSDNDGLTDQEEKALGTNLKEADSDQDGLPDGWEKQNNLNPLDPGDAKQDPDGDGLDNASEYYYKTDPHNPDTDGDGYLDGAEVKSGYDPAKGGGAKLETTREEQKGAATTPAERDKIRKNDLEALGVALELYYEDNNSFPESLKELSPDYVVKIPEDPLAPRYTYQYQKLSPRSYEFTVTIEGDHDPEDLADGTEDHLYEVKVTE